jgi:hypothetical protein
MFFSGLPPTIPYPWEYVYWPQNTIEGGCIDYKNGIDLRKEYFVAGYYTQFLWFDITSGEEQPIELSNENGFFSLTEEHIDKRLRCKMTNANFPWLTGANILVYEVNIGEPNPVIDLVSEIVNQNSIQLSWSPPADSLFIKGYHLYRNNTQLTDKLLTTTSYFDEKLPIGNYEYYVITHYTNGCISEPSNIVEEMIEVGIKEVKWLEGIILYPNPTTGELRIEMCDIRYAICGIEVFDIYGRKHLTVLQSYGLTVFKLDISQLPAGIYFMKITTEKGTTTKKIIKH